MVTKNLADILADSVAFNGADVGTILSGVATLALRLTSTRAGYLDNLSGGAVALNSDIATLLTRLSAVRAGYLDNLNNAQLLNIPNLSTLTSTRIGYLDNINQAGLLQLTTTRAGYLDNLSAGAVALASVCLEARLAELDAANIPADIDTLLSRLTSARAGYLDILNTDSKYIRTTALTAITAYSLADLLYISATEKLRDFIAKTGGTVLPASKSLYDILWVDRTLDESGSFNWDTSAYTTVEQIISSFFTTPLTGTTRRKYWVYLDMTNPAANTAWTNCTIKVKVDIDGTNYVTIDKATKARADLGTTGEPGIPIEVPMVARNVQVTLQFDVALSVDKTIYYHVVTEKMEY